MSGNKIDSHKTIERDYSTQLKDKNPVKQSTEDHQQIASNQIHDSYDKASPDVMPKGPENKNSLGKMGIFAHEKQEMSYSDIKDTANLILKEFMTKYTLMPNGEEHNVTVHIDFYEDGSLKSILVESNLNDTDATRLVRKLKSHLIKVKCQPEQANLLTLRSAVFNA